jgi:hypothetical protein
METTLEDPETPTGQEERRPVRRPTLKMIMF